MALALDQTSKWFILNVVMDPPRVIPIAPFFNLVLGFNRGVSFGLFGDGGNTMPLVLIGLSLAMVVLLVVWLWRAGSAADVGAIGAIIGGALGNVIDRGRDGAVTDFLDFYAGQYHWPAFNLADTAIVLGVGLIVTRALLGFDSAGANRSRRD
ncbi:MAG: signal peptidase II [Acidiferrobacterales bacterium]